MLHSCFFLPRNLHQSVSTTFCSSLLTWTVLGYVNHSGISASVQTFICWWRCRSVCCINFSFVRFSILHIFKQIMINAAELPFSLYCITVLSRFRHVDFIEDGIQLCEYHFSKLVIFVGKPSIRNSLLITMDKLGMILVCYSVHCYQSFWGLCTTGCLNMRWNCRCSLLVLLHLNAC